ncbi:S-methyl-5'-thioadenosine phosphorylase [Candidatus Amarolinea dominans]|uniref:S-methyl-5'-thioadenosine phosphorylase n=1 Tax=Candidatus Amarolinea dominans TaxID=3140696 RepID=UPI001D57397F|nr:S-methyl-5'-thioadenosine phosphorylase [Anaerolineae bacterium]MBK9229662.1 S-methyl-5'-thioadenosine phosphorylase [Anaerolineae bacterium]
MTDSFRIGIIGGSGVYQMEALQEVREITLDTPFGAPSDAYITGVLDGTPVAFLARHGRGHRISPTQLNSRANIWGFKALGVEYLISISACGSLQEGIAPGHIVVPDQLFDRTHLRPLSFFDDPTAGTGGLVVHVSLADPFCPFLSDVCLAAVHETGNPVHQGGVFITIEGPRFSTKGESRIFRQWGCSIIGMTAVPEAQLAREAGMSYATMAHVTDYDVWHETEEPVTVDAVIRVLLHNAEVAKTAVRNAVRLLSTAGPSPQADALKDAIITDRSRIPAQTKTRLEMLIGKYL